MQSFVANVTISQRSLLNKLHVCDYLSRATKTPLKDTTTHEYEAGA